MPVILPPTVLAPPAVVLAAMVVAAPTLGAPGAITLPDVVLAAPVIGTIAAAASGSPVRDEATFIRIDAPLRDVVVIPAPLI